MERLKKLTPLQIYLIGGFLALISGVIVKPFSDAAHTGVVLISLLICLLGIIKYFRG